MPVGILAYGSLVDDPGDELARHVVRKVPKVPTPFRVEYARSSSSRDGAPTLVPVTRGGAALEATVLELDDAIDAGTARRMLHRRETHGARARRPATDADWIREAPDVAGLSCVIYVAFAPNIVAPAPDVLADLAVRSAAREAGRLRLDGISYLDQQMRRGAVTPLTEPYAKAILSRTGARSLDAAWRSVRGSA